jgi:hypothetical protein
VDMRDVEHIKSCIPELKRRFVDQGILREKDLDDLNIVRTIPARLKPKEDLTLLSRQGAILMNHESTLQRLKSFG